MAEPGVPVVLRVDRAPTASSPHDRPGGALPVTGVELSLVGVGLAALIVGRALRAVQR